MPRAFKKPKRPVGNPKKPIDWSIVDLMLEAGALGSRIAARFGICNDTLYERCEIEKGLNWSAYLALKRQDGDNNLLVAQYEKAITSKDNTMLIWLGKQRLQQREPQPLEKNSVPLSDSQLTALLNSLHTVKVEPNASEQQANPIIPASDKTP